MRLGTYMLLVTFTTVCAAPGAALGQWTRFYTPTAVDIRTIESHGSYLFAVGDGGILRSEDDGASWVPANQGLPTDSSYWGLILAGRTLFAWEELSSYEWRLLRTEDNGESWMDVSSPLTDDFDDLLSMGDRLFGVEKLFYTSTDYGESWRETAGKGLEAEDYVYGFQLFADSVDEDLYASSHTGIFKSADNGDSWTLFAGPQFGEKSWIQNNRSIPSYIDVMSFSAVGNNYFVGAIVEVPEEDEMGGSSQKYYEALFRSVDHGWSWTLINWDSAEPLGYVSSIADIGFVALGETLLAYNGQGIFRSRSAGEDWTKVTSGLPVDGEDQTLDLVWDLVAMDDTLFAGTWNGVYMSTDSGDNWVAANSGLPKNNYVNSIVAIGGNLFASVYAHGIFVSANKGKSWAPVLRGSKLARIHDLVSVGEFLYALTSQGPYRSSNNGDGWTALKPMWSFRNHPPSNVVGGDNLYVNTNEGIYSSPDNGNSWKNIGPQHDHEGLVGRLVVNDNIIISSEMLGSVYKSEDWGANWVELDTHFGHEVSPAQLVQLDGALFASGSHGVFISDDFGDRWAQINNGLPTPKPRANLAWPLIPAHLVAVGGHLFARNEGRIFLFNKYDRSWSSFSPSLPGEAVSSISATGDSLFATTEDGTSWRWRILRPTGDLD